MNEEKKRKLDRVLFDITNLVSSFEKPESGYELPADKFKQLADELHLVLSEILACGEADFAQTYIATGISKIFFLQLSEFTTLKTLRINCPTDSHALTIFVEALSKLSGLTTLEIGGGVLFRSKFDSFMALLDRLTNLKTLILKSTYLNPPQERIGVRQVDDLLVLAMNSKYGLEEIMVTSPEVDPADLELFTTAIKLKQKIVNRPKFNSFLIGKHHRAGQDSLVRFLVDDVIETIWKQGSFAFDDIKNSQITRLLQRVDPEKSRQLSLSNKEIIKHLAEKFVLVAPSPKPRIQSATPSTGNRIIDG